MKKVLSYAVVLGLVITGAALTSETQATCSFARLFNSSNPGGYSYVYTPGMSPSATTTTVSDKMEGSFWMLGNGVPGAALNQGIDNGRFDPIVVTSPGYFYYGWVRGFPYYGAYIQGPSWASSPDIDLCPDQVVGQRCMAMLLTDEVNGVGYFALLTDEADGSQNYDFVQAGNGPINLIQTPKVPLLNTDGNISPGNVRVFIDALEPINDLSAGLYLDPACGTFGNPIVGYKVYSQCVAPNGPGDPSQVRPDSRDISQWTDLTPTPVATTSGTQVDVPCGSDFNCYVATSLVFDTGSGFELNLVSEDSVQIQCGPTIADPEPLNRKPGRQPQRKTKR